MIKYSFFLLLAFVVLAGNVNAQSTLDSALVNKEFLSLDEALKHPENVFRLNLSNQHVEFSDSIWSKFPNLQYLSLKNDHLKQIPAGVGELENLKVLDLSGNDFKVLPSTFKNLSKLEELYLNDDKYLEFDKNIPILSALPKLKTLHIESDHLQTLPQEMNKLIFLETLYLNNNEFKEIPDVLKGMKNLQYIDFHNNTYKLPQQDILDQNLGFKIKF